MYIRQQLASSLLLTLLLFTAPQSHAAKAGYISPEQVPGARTVSVDEVKELFDAGAVIVDVRSPRLYTRRHIPGAFHLDLKVVYDEESLAAVAKKDEPLIIYCSGVKCGRSSRASADAVSWGYKEVLYFRGGIVDWRDAGYPTESGETKAKP
jgi:rhodanese-related sulfurtransferase